MSSPKPKKVKAQTKLAAVIALTAVSFLFFGASCQLGGSSEPAATLEYWRVNYDDSAAMDGLIGLYQDQHPDIQIRVTTFDYAEYKPAIIDALAKGKGPDIVSIHNDWLPEMKEILRPIPTGTKEAEAKSFLDYRTFASTYADVAVQDLTYEGLVYGIPLSIDTLALYYNKDIFNNAGVTSPPATYQNLLDVTPTITKKDSAGNITLPAIALGTARNINRSTDILELMMMQNGTGIVSPETHQVTLNQEIKDADGKEFSPAVEALDFYTSFSDPAKNNYSWDLSFDYSIDSFVEGKLGMMFNYSYQRDIIKQKSPHLNFDVAPMIQITADSNAVNYANYFAEAVTAQSQNPVAAWEFLHFLGSKESVQIYNQETGTPTSRRDLISEQTKDPALGVFASQVLTARDWFKPNASVSEKIFADMIDSIILGQSEPAEAVNKATTLLTAEVAEINERDEAEKAAAEVNP